jgi:hypothetical protein
MALGASPATADLISDTRAYFPDRAWLPVTAMDGAQVGAGRAVDAAASWSVNPATLTQLIAATRNMLRLNGVAIDVSRKDVVATTENFSDQSPFIYFGEAALAFPLGQWVVGASLSPYTYDKQKMAFVDTTAGQAPTPLTVDMLSSVDRASISAARRLGKWSVAVSGEGYLSREQYSSTPSEDAQMFGAVPASVDLSGSTFGGALGAEYQALPWLSAGAVARAAGDIDLKEDGGAVVGSDEIPFTFELGAQLGKGSGGNLFVDAAYQAERQVALGDSVGRGTEVSPARWNLAASYAYRPKEAKWEFGAGFGLSPRPSGGGASMTRFGIGLGYDLDGLMARGSFSQETRSDVNDRESTRRFFYLGVDIAL